MSPPEPKRPWWRRRRWIAAAALWLAWPILYALSSGPTMYCACRWWIQPSTWRLFYVEPFGVLPGALDQGPFSGSDYVAWWRSFGYLHYQQQQFERKNQSSVDRESQER